MIVRWNQQYGLDFSFNLKWSWPAAPLPQLSYIWSDLCVQLWLKYSECNVFGVVLFLHVYLCCFCSWRSVTEYRRQFRCLFTDKHLIKVRKINLMSSFCLIQLICGQKKQEKQTYFQSHFSAAVPSTTFCPCSVLTEFGLMNVEVREKVCGFILSSYNTTNKVVTENAQAEA